MPYVEVPAAPSLHSLVECYWRIKGPAPAHRVLPDGCIDILLLGDSPRAEVVGTMTHAIVASASDRGAIGIRFRPGEAARLLPAAPRELTDRDAPLVEVWGEHAVEIEDALSTGLGATAAELEKLTARLDAILGRQLARVAGPVDTRVRTATQLLAGGASVRDVARATCLSERQLARRFEARVGIAPKIFGRVMRLQRAAIALSTGASCADAAGRAGYADQAHFTRDATALAGITPRGLAKERGADMSDSSKTDPAAAA